jgi:hypothetical protein
MFLYCITNKKKKIKLVGKKKKKIIHINELDYIFDKIKEIEFIKEKNPSLYKEIMDTIP